MNRVIIIGGGAGQIVAAKPSLIPNELIVYADVSEEVHLVMSRLHRNSKLVVPITLGAGDTVPTLIAKVKDTYPDAEQILEYFKNELPAVATDKGMGMWAPLGRMAITAMNTNGDLRKTLLRGVFSPVFKHADGTIQSIDIISINSLSGGSGGGAGYILPQLLMGAILERQNININKHFIRIGAITYHGLGENIYPNTGVRLVEDLTHIMAPDRHVRENRSMWLVELPIVDKDKELRDQLAGQLMQALYWTGKSRHQILNL